MFKVEIKVKLDFAKIRVYIIHKMDGSIVKYTKYLKCESKHNYVCSLVVSWCGVCSKVLGSNPSACHHFFVLWVHFNWQLGLSGAGLRGPYEKKVWLGQISIDSPGWCGAGLRRPEEKKSASAARSLVQSLNGLATFFWIINSQHLLFELLIVDVGCGFFAIAATK